MEDYKFKDLTDDELRFYKNKAQKTELSPFAKFCREVSSYTFSTMKGTQLDKWEVFDMGFKNTRKLLSGEYPVKVSPKGEK